MEGTLAARKDKLNKQLAIMNTFAIENDSNYKFMNLLRSRLTEEGIPVEIAANIVAHLDYDLSAANEDDDYIGDVALAYAEYAGRIYKRFGDTGWQRNISPSIIKKYFTQDEVKL